MLYLLTAIFLMVSSLSDAATNYSATHTFSNGIYTVVEKHVLKDDQMSWSERGLSSKRNDATGIDESVFATNTYVLTQEPSTPYVVVLKKTGPDFQTNPYQYLFLSKEAWAETCTGDELSMPDASWTNLETCDDHGVVPQ